MDYHLSCIILSSTSLGLSASSILFIVYHAFVDFNLIMHFTCFIGACVVATLDVLDFFRAISLIKFSASLSGIYFISTSMTAILSCYILLQLGTNFYQEYNNLKTTLMYAPIVVTFGMFSCSVFTTVQFLLSESKNPNSALMDLTLALSLLSALLTLLYAVAPLYNIRHQTKLQPEQTAISIIHFTIVLVLFISHFAVYSKIAFDDQFSEMNMSSIHNIILLLIFPGCLIKPPRVLVKKIKRMVLGVEELTIGGEYRPDMLPNNYADTVSGPKILHPLTLELRNNTDNIEGTTFPPRNEEHSSTMLNVQSNQVDRFNNDGYLNGGIGSFNVGGRFNGINNSFIDGFFN